MLRASIRSALEKYESEIVLGIFRDFRSENIDTLTYLRLSSVISVDIEKSLKILDDPNHHKMMRKELVMNIFPFGNDGTDPTIVINLVCNRTIYLNFNYLRNLGIQLNNSILLITYILHLHIKITLFSAKDTFESASSRY